MDTTRVTPQNRKPAWWEVRAPALYYIVGATLIVSAVLPWFDSEQPTTLRIIGSVIGVAAAIIVVAAATATVVGRRRGTLESGTALHPQQSDPSRR